MRIAFHPECLPAPQPVLAQLLCVLAMVSITTLCRAECKATPELETKVQTQADAAAYTELGTWFAQQQQFDCSTQAFQSAVKLEPGSAMLNYFLGLSIYSSGHAEASIPPLQQAIQLSTTAIQPHMLLGAIFHQLGKRSDAEAQWRAVLQIDPTYADALDALSNSLIDGGDSFVAINLLKPAPKNEMLILNLARAYGVAGMLDDAAATLQQALDADPSNYHFTSAMVTVMVHQRRYQDAIALMQKYLQQHPDDTTAQIAYLNALVLNNDKTAARPLAAKLLLSFPHDFDVLYLNGYLERQAADYPSARDHLQQAVALHPDNYDARFNLGIALAHLDDPTNAKLQFEKAITLDGSQSQAHFQLAGVLRALNQPDAAQEQLKIFKDLSSADTARSQADTRAQLAAQKLAAGDLKQAVALYQQAVAATPKSAYLQYQYALALAKSGDTATERTALEQAVKVDPTFAIAQNLLGYLESRSGEQAEAAKHFQQAVAAAPAFTDAWINLAATLAQQGNLPEAQQAIARALALDANNTQAQQLSQKLAQAAQH